MKKLMDEINNSESNPIEGVLKYCTENYHIDRVKSIKFSNASLKHYEKEDNEVFITAKIDGKLYHNMHVSEVYNTHYHHDHQSNQALIEHTNFFDKLKKLCCISSHETVDNDNDDYNSNQPMTSVNDEVNLCGNTSVEKAVEIPDNYLN